MRSSILMRVSRAACLMIVAFQFSALAQNGEFDLGMKSARAGDFPQAVVHFQNSYDRNLPAWKLAQIHYNLGVCFYQLKQLDKAVAAFESAVALKADYEKAFYALGMAYADLQKWDQAEAAFQKATKLDGGRNGEAWFDLAFIYIGQKNYDAAFASFQKAIKYKSVATPACHNNIGVIYAMKGNMPMALKEIERAKRLGYKEAEDNLKYLSKIMNEGDSAFLSKLIPMKVREP